MHTPRAITPAARRMGKHVAATVSSRAAGRTVMTRRSSDGNMVGRGNAAGPSVISAFALLLAMAGSPAHASTLLTAGKVGIFRSVPGREPAALVRVTGDPALRTVPAPTCPATSSLG